MLKRIKTRVIQNLYYHVLCELTGASAQSLMQGIKLLPSEIPMIMVK